MNQQIAARIRSNRNAVRMKNGNVVSQLFPDLQPFTGEAATAESVERTRNAHLDIGLPDPKSEEVLEAFMDRGSPSERAMMMLDYALRFDGIPKKDWKASKQYLWSVSADLLAITQRIEVGCFTCESSID